ncbi:hypothetical protein NWL46_003899 [Salmonella enterica]|nr:hypothetical protein [Salmonella enterica]
MSRWLVTAVARMHLAATKWKTKPVTSFTPLLRGIHRNQENLKLAERYMQYFSCRFVDFFRGIYEPFLKDGNHHSNTLHYFDVSSPFMKQDKIASTRFFKYSKTSIFR